MHMNAMTSNESEWDSEEDCQWEWDIPQQASFAHGKNIGMMTYREMYETVIQWHLKVAGANRKQRAQPGRQKLDRRRGVADAQKRKRRDSDKCSKEKRARNDFGGDPVLQLRDRIVRHGLKSGDYVQIANDRGEKWFMRIVNGKVLFKNSDDPVLTSALWCETNDVTKLSSRFSAAETCEIRGIIDAGPISKFKNKSSTAQQK